VAAETADNKTAIIDVMHVRNMKFHRYEHVALRVHAKLTCQ
jgi:hypothetical protein